MKSLALIRLVRPAQVAFTALALCASVRTTTATTAGLGTLPLYFESSSSHGGFQFQARGLACNFFVAPTKARLMLAKPGSSETAELQLEFLKASAQARVSGSTPLAGRANYFLGRDPAEWRTSIPLFQRVVVSQLYPGVDLIYYGNEKRLEYDFVVSPGTDPRTISLRFSGADEIQVSEQGELVFRLGTEEIRQPKPVVYQTVKGERRAINGDYCLTDGSTVSFRIGEYDKHLPLVIDPVLSYSTYFGGGGVDAIYGLKVDKSGFVYLTGETMGGLPTNSVATNLTTRLGAYQGGSASHGDAFVAKFDNSGTSLVYLAYLGGRGGDAAKDIAVDENGSAYITGFTESSDFPTTTNAYRKSISGKPYPGLTTYPVDAFVTKLSPSGTSLEYSTYLGGDWTDEGVGIAVDDQGLAYIAGFTASTNFPTTNCAAYLTNYSLAGDAFVARISPTGDVLDYSLYLGGTNLDVGSGIAVNRNGVAFVTGYTRSLDFPAQNFPNGGADAFVTQITVVSNVAALGPSALIGGRGDNFGYRVALDDESNAYLVGASINDQSVPVSPSSINPGGVFRSADAGASWSQSSAGLRSVVTTALAVDPAAPAHVVAATWHGVAQSWDGGATWFGPNTGTNRNLAALAGDAGVGTVLSLAISPGSPSTLYIGTATDGVGTSLDGGTNVAFATTNVLNNQPVRALAVDALVATTVYAGTDAGIFKRTAADTNWFTVNNGLGNLSVRALAVHPEAPLYAGTAGGIYRSSNGGTNWNAFNAGLSNLSVRAIVIVSNSPSVLYAGTDGGIFKSINRGTNWTRTITGLGNSTNVTSLCIDPVVNTTMYAGTTSGLFKTTDGGENWTFLTNGPSVTNILALAISSESPATVYAGTKGAPNRGGKDVFIAKSGTNGYYAVLGGAADEEGWDLAVDAAGRAYIVGFTTSTNFPTVNPGGALTSTNRGGVDAFTAELATDGSTLLQSAYLGGTNADYAFAIAIDDAGGIFVAGMTASRDFPITAAYQSVPGNTNDAFLAKILTVLPPLTIASLERSVGLSWPAAWGNLPLQSSTNLLGGWQTLTNLPALQNGRFTVTVATDQATPAVFFRFRP